jgi:hypothetical protein
MSSPNKNLLNMATPTAELKHERTIILAQVTSLNQRLTVIKTQLAECIDLDVMHELIASEEALEAERGTKLAHLALFDVKPPVKGEEKGDDGYMTAHEGEDTDADPPVHKPRPAPRLCTSEIPWAEREGAKIVIPFKELIDVPRLKEEHRLERHLTEIEETFVDAGLGRRVLREFVPADGFRRVAIRKLLESLPPNMQATLQLFLDHHLQSQWKEIRTYLVRVFMGKSRLTAVLERKMVDLHFPGHSLIDVFIAEAINAVNLFHVIEGKGPGQDLKGKRELLERILAKCPESYRLAALMALQQEQVDLEYCGLEAIDVWAVLTKHAKEAEMLHRMSPKTISAQHPQAAGRKMETIEVDHLAALFDTDNRPIPMAHLRENFPYLYGIFGPRRAIAGVVELGPEPFQAQKLVRGEAKTGPYAVACFTVEPNLEYLSASAKKYNCNARVFTELSRTPAGAQSNFQ